MEGSVAKKKAIQGNAECPYIDALADHGPIRLAYLVRLLLLG